MPPASAPHSTSESFFIVVGLHPLRKQAAERQSEPARHQHRGRRLLQRLVQRRPFYISCGEADTKVSAPRFIRDVLTNRCTTGTANTGSNRRPAGPRLMLKDLPEAIATAVTK